MRNRFGFASSTREWLLRNFALGKANYWFTFFADSATALFFLGWELSRGTRPWQAIAAVLSGYLLWGLTEYVFHRWVYHQPDGIFGDGHRIHHIEAETLIAMPWFMTTITMFSIWFVLSCLFGIRFFAGIAAGWLAGFVWYSLVHHSHHHWDIRLGWARRLKAYHRIHHHFPDTNYGVTMRLWDLVFGTRHRRPSEAPAAVPGRVRASAAADR